MERKIWMVGAALGLAGIGAIVTPSSALAAAPDESGSVTRTPMVDSWVYSDGELFVFTGPEAVNCSGPPEFELFDVTVASPVRTGRSHRGERPTTRLWGVTTDHSCRENLPRI
jgi:hypothetical protein